MLGELERRLTSDPETELVASAEEQRLITRLRLAKLLAMHGDTSGLTTHVLDLSRGRPGAGVTVKLLRLDRGNSFIEIAERETDADGRVKSFFDSGASLAPGVYRLRFETQAYFERAGVETFWPHVEIAFRVTDPAQHHHVPLLLGPFGYTTYRGS
jgi:5-hydroxyisourate hydrolase